MKQLAITADDFGWKKDLDEGIRQTCTEGVVTHVSLMANGETIESAAKFLTSHPQVSAGIHLNLSEGKPLSKARGLNRLLDSDENFLGPGNHLRVAYVACSQWTFLSEAIELEYRAQIERVRDLGMRIAQLNGHGHTHLTPKLFGLVLKLAAEYQIPIVRGVDEWSGLIRYKESLDRCRISSILSTLTFWNRVSKSFRLHLDRIKINRCTGIFDSGHLNEEKLNRLLGHAPDGFSELICHPGARSKAFRTDPENYDWDSERLLMISNAVKEKIEKLQIRRVNFWEAVDSK